MSAPPYRGRFAPTPSGPLHFGSLVAAAGSFLDARAHGGEWHVRIDDLDPPRVVPGAADAILRTLEAHGFEWDGPVVYQSHRTDRYRAALEHLERGGYVYPCTCTRAEILAAGLPGAEGPRYAGSCRAGPRAPGRRPALRVCVGTAVVAFEDLLQGPITRDLAETSGDFVVQRADGVFGYHLACVTDDADSGFGTLVRGADLLESSARQILLQRYLGLPVPQYLHLPVVLGPGGEKLSKQTLAPAADSRLALPSLVAALAFLGQPVPPDAVASGLTGVWAWARAHWSRERLPRRHSAPIEVVAGPPAS